MIDNLTFKKLWLLLWLASGCALSARSEGGDPRPNIVVILADDMGYGDLRSYNSESKIATPNLDRMASEGLVFTDAHSGGSTCKPSRYALLTGRFAARKDRFDDRGGPIIAAGRPTVAGMLRDRGYRTAMVGKWHLGFDQDGPRAKNFKKGFAFDYAGKITGGPVDRGFDSFFGMHASLDIPPYFYIRDREAVQPPTGRVEDHDSTGGDEGWNHIQGAFWRGGDIAPDFKHVEVTPRFADEACKVIESHRGKRPLFLYLALPSPHTPWLPTEEFVGKSGAGMYGDFMMLVDSVVGRVLTSLEAAGMDKDTLVLFSSDNGPVWYEKDVQRFGHRSTGRLRGAKGSVWEGGHRVPFIARWPAKVKPGGRSDQLVSFADLFATLAEVAGDNPAGGNFPGDSVSFLPVLLAPDREHAPRPPLLHGGKVLRDGDWKLIATKGGRGFGADKSVKYGIALYNLREDPSEKNNLAGSEPERVEAMRALLQKILGEESGRR